MAFSRISVVRRPARQKGELILVWVGVIHRAITLEENCTASLHLEVVAAALH